MSHENSFDMRYDPRNESPYFSILVALDNGCNRAWGKSAQHGESAAAYLRGLTAVRQWYTFLRPIAEGKVAPTGLDSELSRVFPNQGVTTQSVKSALEIDPSGSAWL